MNLPLKNQTCVHQTGEPWFQSLEIEISLPYNFKDNSMKTFFRLLTTAFLLMFLISTSVVVIILTFAVRPRSTDHSIKDPQLGISFPIVLHPSKTSFISSFNDLCY